ncbi:MAG TPA: hypothetical protein PKA58_37160, partial [Polyangium sp.]|nr:hypothetical protein [Polyangium sp.]
MPNREATSAKQSLGIDRLILQIHDASFPSDPDEDWGRGSPYSRGADRFFEFAERLGFDAIQLGPQGLTQRGNPSPYDATLFSRNPLNLPLRRLVEQKRIRRETLTRLVAQHRSDSPETEVSHRELHDRFQSVLDEVIAGATAADRAAARDFIERNEY